MDSTMKSAFITSQCAVMSAKLAAMQEQNRQDLAAGRLPSYNPHDFENLPDEFGLGHNDVISYLMEY